MQVCDESPRKRTRECRLFRCLQGRAIARVIICACGFAPAGDRAAKCPGTGTHALVGLGILSIIWQSTAGHNAASPLTVYFAITALVRTRLKFRTRAHAYSPARSLVIFFSSAQISTLYKIRQQQIGRDTCMKSPSSVRLFIVLYKISPAAFIGAGKTRSAAGTKCTVEKIHVRYYLRFLSSRMKDAPEWRVRNAAKFDNSVEKKNKIAIGFADNEIYYIAGLCVFFARKWRLLRTSSAIYTRNLYKNEIHKSRDVPDNLFSCLSSPIHRALLSRAYLVFPRAAFSSRTFRNHRFRRGTNENRQKRKRSQSRKQLRRWSRVCDRAA